MSDFLVIGPVVFKLSTNVEAVSHPKNDGWLVLKDHDFRVYVKSPIKFEEKYLKSTIYQAQLAEGVFINFEEAYALGKDAIDDGYYEDTKENCGDCKIDEDLCNREHDS